MWLPSCVFQDSVPDYTTCNTIAADYCPMDCVVAPVPSACGNAEDYRAAKEWRAACWSVGVEWVTNVWYAHTTHARCGLTPTCHHLDVWMILRG